MSEWSDELKEKVVKMYEESNPTPENTVEICADIAEQVDKTPNGVRIILMHAGVWVKKAQAKKDGASSDDKPKRVSKQDAIDALKELLEERNAEVDSAILDKLTGKAAVYFTNVINSI